MNALRGVAVALLLACGSEVAEAQFAPGTRTASMAGAGLVFASGLDAVELNPANLGVPGAWQVSLFELGGSVLVSGTTLSDLREMGTNFGSGDPQLVAALPADGITIESATDGFLLANVARAADVPGPGSPYPTIGVAVGSFALRVRSQMLTTATVSKEVMDLAVLGYEPERIQDYAVRNTGVRVASFSEITVAYGRRLDALGLGVALRRVQGHKLTQIRLFEPEIDLNQQTFTLAGAAVESPGGSGYGVDVGMTLDLGPGLRWSLAMRNALQRMSWNQGLRAHEGTFTDADFDAADFDVLVDRFTASTIDPASVSLPVFQAAQGLFDEAFFPTIVNAGVGWSGGGTRVELVGTAVGPLGRQRSVWDQRLSLGVEQRLPVLTLRGGYAHGDEGVRAIALGVGLGLGPVELEAGVGSISGSRPDGTAYDGIHGSLGLSVRRGGE